MAAEVRIKARERGRFNKIPLDLMLLYILIFSLTAGVLHTVRV